MCEYRANRGNPKIFLRIATIATIAGSLGVGSNSGRIAVGGVDVRAARRVGASRFPRRAVERDRWFRSGGSAFWNLSQGLLDLDAEVGYFVW